MDHVHIYMVDIIANYSSKVEKSGGYKALQQWIIQPPPECLDYQRDQ